MIGAGVGEVREARVLNRILRITELGWEYEPDQRHAEMIVEQLGLKDAKSVETPTEENKWEREEDEKSSMPTGKSTSGVSRRDAITSRRIDPT